MRFQILISRYQLIYRPPLLLKLQTCWFPLWIRYGTWKAELIQFTTIRVNWSIWQRSSWNSEEMWKFPCISQFVDDKWVRTQYLFLWGFPDGTSGKESTSQCRRARFDSWVRKIPWRRHRLPTPVFMGFPGGSDSKKKKNNLPAMRETWVRSLDGEDLLE